jgi:recombinational DNA repair protein RecT
MEQQLSKRAAKALEVLEAGGKFRKQLETQYRGGEKFEMRLKNAQGQVVKGIGYQTFCELVDARKLTYVHPHDAVSSVWPQEWVLCREGMVATNSKY